MRDEVCLSIETPIPEKLLNRALSQGLRFHSIERLDARRLRACLSASDAKRLKALNERFSIPTSVLYSRGLSIIWRKMRDRVTLAAGLAVFAALFGVFFGRIWRVDVTFLNGTSVDPVPYASALEAHGVRPGMVAGTVNTALISDLLEAEVTGCGYAGVRRQGVRLLVEIAPEAPAPQVYDLSDAHSLYAGQDGIVVDVNVQYGEACVKPGETVRRGQLLIQGVERASKEGLRPIAALGQVTIRAWCEGEARSPLQRERITRTGRLRRSAVLSTVWGDLSIAQSEPFAQEQTEMSAVPIGGLFFPLELVRLTGYEVVTTLEPVDERSLRRRLEAIAYSAAALELSLNGPEDAAIVRGWSEDETTSGQLTVRSVYEIYTNTAVTREALLQGG